jgi:hypothetical protein
MTRRRFLEQAGAIPLILGFPALAKGQEPKAGDELLKQALERMKKENTFGVILRIPDQEKERQDLGVALLRLLESKRVDVEEIFAQAVFVCLERKETEAAVLIDDAGSRIDGAKLAIADFQDADRFVRAFRALLHGEGERRLKERSEKIRKTLDEEAVRALDRLDDDEPKTRDQAVAVLSKHAAGAIPFLVDCRLRAESGERRERLAQVIRGHFARMDEKTRLPYGTTIFEQRIDGCPLCGRGSVPPSSRRFLKFLSK